MRVRLVLAALALLSFSFPALAGPKMPGLQCTELGSTTMGDDRTTLVGCMLLYSDPSATGASCALAATVGNSCVWKAMSALSGGGCYTDYSLSPTPPWESGGGRAYPNSSLPPELPVGSPCQIAGYVIKGSLGTWGMCGDFPPNGGQYISFFRPPGGTCPGGPNGYLYEYGRTYQCCQN